MHFLSSLKPKSLQNKICLVRIDLNTEDNWRLMASLSTLKFLTANCRSVIILSHKGRPNGFKKSLSLRKYTKELSKLLKKLVVFFPYFRFEEIKNLIQSSPKKSVFLLENLRFLKEEADNNLVLAEHLASMGDFYVNDAFAVSHRANASVVAIAKYLPSYAGFGLEAEVKNLSQVMKNPEEPLVIILGGLKIEDKLGVVKNLQQKASAFLIGGALNKKILGFKMPKLIMAVDFKYEKGIIRDIGPQSIKLFQKYIQGAKTIFWNGPLGNINKKQFQNGTKAIIKSVIANKKAFKVTGGGETVMYLKKLKLDKKFNFISTGGGAMLDFLTGKELPGIKALK